MQHVKGYWYTPDRREQGGLTNDPAFFRRPRSVGLSAAILVNLRSLLALVGEWFRPRPDPREGSL